MQRVVAIDPGGTTGYAILEDGHIRTGQFKDSQGLDLLIHPKDVVILEIPFWAPAVNPALNLIVYEVKGAVLERVRSKGCQLIAQKASIPAFMYQRHALGKKLRGGSQHQKDALCHLWYFLTHNLIHNDNIRTIQECFALTKKTSKKS